ncbi:MAG TPA: hypothetical protein VIQ80_02475 [Candidatus Saccharimonadales bacterium]
MIVHVVGSIRNPQVDAAYLHQIIDVIHSHGAVLALNWLEPALLRTKDNPLNIDWTAYVEVNIDAIKRADIIVVDLTHYSFSQGYIVAAAFQYKKPVLAVSRNNIRSHTASGIANSLFTYKKYSNENELQSIVREFLLKNTIHTKDLRFNMFLTRRIFKYLEDTMRETGKSRSEIIRELVMRKINQEHRNG